MEIIMGVEKANNPEQGRKLAYPFEEALFLFTEEEREEAERIIAKVSEFKAYPSKSGDLEYFDFVASETNKLLDDIGEAYGRNHKI